MKFCNYGMRVIVLCLSMVVQNVYSELDVNLESTNVKLIQTLEMRFCYISFVEIDGEEYIVKQKKSDCIRKLMGVVRDAVMAHFAENFINAHHVTIIPAGKAFIGKPRTDWPATIHTIAPGKMIKAQNSPYNSMNIKQADEGFRRDMLAWMLEDEMLILIVAYDTFFCNHDRHRGNLFYNPKDDSFCAIDMDSSFRYNLCDLACKNFKAMLESKHFYLKNKEIKALVAFKEHLQFLINKYNPNNTLKIYDYFVEKAGFVEGAPFFLPKFAVEIQENKRVISRSYEDAKKLVVILEEVIGKAKKRREYAHPRSSA